MGQKERFHDAEVASAAELGPVEVAPGIRMLAVRTPTLPPATHTNLFLVGCGEAVLVEPASPYEGELDRVVALVEEAASRGVRPTAILATHHHPDHVGGALGLRDRLQLPLWAHRETAARLHGEIDFDREVDDGERIPLAGDPPMELRALHTPGHAPGHLCFLEPRSGALIAGDMVAGIGTIVVDPIDGDMRRYLESLQKMRSEGAALLLPAHGGPIADVRRCLDYYLEHRLERERRVEQALAKHPDGATAPALLPEAYGDAPKAAWPLALQAIESHLIKLMEEGRARRTAGERWQVPPP